MNMEFLYEIINATRNEENIINSIIKFVFSNYSDKINIHKLKKIEVVDKLDNNSSGRSIRDKIILPRKYGLEDIEYEQDVLEDKCIKPELKMLISSIYHELWHISTWEKYETMYEYVLDEKNSDFYTSYAYMYWIEYVAHMETVILEVPDIMNTFCKNFVYKKWHKIEYGYSYFIKALPYYLVRANYLNIFDELTGEIISSELKSAVYKFDKASKYLFQNSNMNDIEKANVIRDMIVKLFE